VKHGIQSNEDRDARAVLDAIRRIVQMLRVSSRAAERDAGVSGAQLFVLEKLSAASGPLSVGELARRTLTHQSSVSVVVQKLVERGLVARARDRADARQVALSPTAAGRKALRAAPSMAQDRLILAVTRLPPRERMHLASVLGRLVDDAGLRAPGTAPMFFEDARSRSARRGRGAARPPKTPADARSRRTRG
jgi:DNA-binding MarR family transcriptional regulator